MPKNVFLSLDRHGEHVSETYTNYSIVSDDDDDDEFVIVNKNDFNEFF